MINLGKTYYPNLNFVAVEKHYDAKFICEIAIKNFNGWTEFPVQLYYQPAPVDPSFSNYFGIYLNHEGKVMITNGSSIVGMPIEAIKTKKGEIIFSRYRHDFRKADTEDIHVDGGLDYLRLVGNIHDVTKTILTIKEDQLVEVTNSEEIKQLYLNKKNALTSPAK